MGDRMVSFGALPKPILREFTEERIRIIYESAFLRSCYHWEWFIESTFIDSLCTSAGVMHGGKLLRPAFRNYRTAEAIVLGARAYINWANIDIAIDVFRRFVQNGRHEQVLMSSRARLVAMFQVRHHIAHNSRSSFKSFQSATMFLGQKRYLDGGAGEFLRDRDRSSGEPKRYFDSLCGNLALSHSRSIPNL